MIYLSGKNEEMDKEEHWSYYVETLFYEMEGFDQHLREKKIDDLMS
jgi:hypothetical protein